MGNNTEVMSNNKRIAIGILGGIAAIVNKFIGQADARYTVQKLLFYRGRLSEEAITDIYSSSLCYLFSMVAFAFIGALVAWASDENKKIKLLALSIAAPALISSWSMSGGPPDIPKVGNTMNHDSTIGRQERPISEPNLNVKERTFSFMSTAYAGDTQSDGISKKPSSFIDSFKFFFSGHSRVTLYWVIVKSTKDRSEAEAFAQKINDIDPGLNAFVGWRSANDYYPVIVGELSPLDEAQQLKERALRLEIISEVYLSPD